MSLARTTTSRPKLAMVTMATATAAADADTFGNAVSPSPAPEIPAGHGPPVRAPHPHDVLSGRGMRISTHPGNVRFRAIVERHKPEYLDVSTSKARKARIAAAVVASVRALDPPGRFLADGSRADAPWEEIGDARALKKAGQALREGAPAIKAERQARMEALAMGAVAAAARPSPSGGRGEGFPGSGREFGERRGGELGADAPDDGNRLTPADRELLAATYRNQINRSSCDDLPPRHERNVDGSYGSGLSFQMGERSRPRQQARHGEDSDSRLLAGMRQEWRRMHLRNASHERELLQQKKRLAAMLRQNLMRQIRLDRMQVVDQRNQMQVVDQRNQMRGAQRQNRMPRQNHQIRQQPSPMQQIHLQTRFDRDAAEPPSPRNRPSPPDREGLDAASSSGIRRSSRDEMPRELLLLAAAASGAAAARNM